jgi:hypothetical protein
MTHDTNRHENAESTSPTPAPGPVSQPRRTPLSDRALRGIASSMYSLANDAGETEPVSLGDGLFVKLEKQHKGYRLSVLREERRPDYSEEFLPVGAAFDAPVSETGLTCTRPYGRQPKTGRTIHYYALSVSWRQL